MGKSVFLVRVVRPAALCHLTGGLCHISPISLDAGLPWSLECFQLQRPLWFLPALTSLSRQHVLLAGWASVGRTPSLESALFKGSVLKRVWELWDPGMSSFQSEGGDAGVELSGEFTCTAPAILYPSEKYGSCVSFAEQMDELLQRCFLHALKCHVKKADLPLLTSTFLGSHMFSCWYGRQVWATGLSLVPWWYVRTGV